MDQLPATFSTAGTLPAGDYSMTLAMLRESILVLGPGEPKQFPTWDASWRATLVDNLEILSRQLWAVGIDRIFVNGSFVEDKDRPNDIDGYFEVDPIAFPVSRLRHELNLLDEHKVWTWDRAARRPYSGSKLQLPMWHVYRVELYPHYPGLVAGRDKFGNGLEFPAFFRQRRIDGSQKGIVELIPDNVKE